MRRAGLLLAAILAAAVSFPAWGQGAPLGPCGERAEVLEMLERKYGESRVAFGVANNGGLVEVVSAGDGGTWSILITSPKGMSCLVAAGDGWQAWKLKQPDEGT